MAYIRTVTAGAALAVAAVCVCPAAHADNLTIPEKAYLLSLQQQHIRYPSTTYAINAGHQVCASFDNNVPFLDLLNTVHTNSGMDEYSSGFLIGAAVQSFCPGNRAKLPG
ncbi:hypothetical protein MINS_24280 [Mycolicibacterium insubricum]|uniref:Uncharacterized protein n=1 Tax=Mycolicibacterium insubricum TaxID=444597 RepID=A0A1X0DF98_9MYCO|nr:DUF732 domain-containing protein [Mycolicibacterium insubricum]MCV7083016.1 DUF732 domain-containing protein [Mycolicibacterium insubricum]ORA71074.1 hypothetical protein BST26_09365 [Mycolicibacterium insubricum]BBZ66999.1 hypothetical protein MINS_24280 [Mycolicibacterium insubricum]